MSAAVAFEQGEGVVGRWRLFFRLGPETELPPGARRGLVYFRRVAHQQETAVATGALLGREIRRCYHLGNRVVDADGRELQAARTIEVGHEVFRG